jgi:hypothetical protein
VLAHKIKFYGWAGCSTCAFSLPLLSLGHKENLIEEIEPQIWAKKEIYQEIIRDKLLDKYWSNSWRFYWKDSGIPTPTILVKLTAKSSNWRLVRPDIALSIANEVSRYLMDNGGDVAVMNFLDNEYQMDLFFRELLMEMVANTLAPDSGKTVIIDNLPQ